MLLITHPAFYNIARLAAQAAGISEDRIVSIERPANSVADYTTLDDLADFGASKAANFFERRFRPGEAKTTLAFLSFSSGTTGMYPACLSNGLIV